MSEHPAAPRPAARPAGKENVFTHKIGPLPMWGWVAIIGGVLVAWRMYSSKNAATAAAQNGTSPTSTDTSANTVPQFVNQTYVSTTAPSAPATPPAAPPPVVAPPVTGGGGDDDDGSPSNPAPVGSSTQPKPTTTKPGSWHYPAPTGLKTYDQSSTGVRLSWNAITGPSGQHPNSYTVATYDSKGKLVDQFTTKAGNTATAEYGKGGKGLPKGTYHTNVWGNGGPIAPPHATVQYTVSK